jgi:hypothetical protein
VPLSYTQTVRFEATVTESPASVAFEYNSVDRPMYDDGTHGDLVAGDGTWTTLFQANEILNKLTTSWVYRPFIGYCKPAGSSRYNIFAEIWTPDIGLVSQFVIEEIFHEMKDRRIGTWWPLRHWTDSKIQVHGLYCTIAVLLRALLWRRARQAGLRLSMAGLLEKLGQIQQVINVYPAKRAGQPVAEQSVLTKRDEIQEKLIEILGLQMPKSAF